MKKTIFCVTEVGANQLLIHVLILYNKENDSKISPNKGHTD